MSRNEQALSNLQQAQIFDIPEFLKRHVYLISALLFLNGFLLKSQAFGLFLLHGIYALTGIHLDETFRLAGFAMTGSCFLLLGLLLILFSLSGDSGSLLPRKYYPLTGLACILLFYWNYIIGHAVNIPITDDYFAILRFLIAYTGMESATDKVNLLWTPYVETRNVVVKLTVLLYSFVFTEINFKSLVVLVNLSLCGTGYLVYRTMDRTTFRHMLSIPLALLLFQCSYYDAQLWSTAGMHIQLTLFFVVASLFFLQGKKITRFVLALMMGCLAVFTYGNGLIVFPAGMILLLTLRERGRLLIWTGFFLFILLFYFSAYQPVRSTQQMLAINPISILTYCLVFWGSAFQFMYRVELPFVTGMIFLLVFAWLLRKRYYTLNPFNFSILVYVLCSALMASLFRLDTAEGFRQALANRYGIYSCLGVICSLIAVAELYGPVFKKRIWPGLLTGCAIYFLAAAFFFYPETRIRITKLEDFRTAFLAGQATTASPPLIPPGADTIITQAINLKLYKP